MITELDIEAARLTIGAAEQDLAEAERMPSGPDPARWVGANARLRLAVAQHAQLVEQRAAEVAATEQRAATEKSSAKRVAEMTKEAVAGRDKVTAAFAAAQDALVALADAVHERNATVMGIAAELVSLGLAIPEGADDKTGATLRGAVRLRGAWWMPVMAGPLLDVAVARIKATRLGSRDGSEVEVRRIVKTARLHERPDVALEAVPMPPSAPDRPMPHVLRRAESFSGAPVGISDYRREEEMKNREVTWVTPRSDEDTYGPRYVK